MGELAVPGRQAPPPGILFPPFLLDSSNEQLWRGDELIALKPKPFSVLRYLLQRPLQLVKKEELLAQLWGDVTVGEAVLKTCLSDIRQALGDSARAPRFIETAHRRGYRFIGRVELMAPPEAEAPPQRSGTLATGGEARTCLSPFVGRDAELGTLQQALRRALLSERQVVLITGEPGIGKTLLVNAFLEQACATDAPWIGGGQCIDQYGKGEPYMPVLEALGRLCRGPGGDEVIRVLRSGAPAWLLDMPGLIPGSERNAVQHKEPSAAPERMLREMAETLEALSDTRACVLVLEDLHWADYSTLDLISYIARRSGPAKLLVIGTYRPLDVSAGPDHRGGVLYELPVRAQCEEVRLSHLNEKAVSEYLARRFPAHVFPAQLSHVLQVRTAGNPLFMCRVVDGWLERGLFDEKGYEALAAAFSGLSREVPDSVLRMIDAELNRLSTFEQKVLQAASAAGVGFSLPAVAYALGEEVVRVEELCTRWAWRGRFLHVTGTSEWPDRTPVVRCEFIHALYHQVLYERMGPTLRAHFHQRIGERLEAAYGELAPSIAAELAMHFERARDYPRAVRYLRIAGERALSRSACREAAEHLERGLGLLEKLPSSQESLALELDLHIPLGTALCIVKGYAAPQVEKVYARARELCDIVGQTPYLLPVLCGLASFYLVRAAHRESHQVGMQFLHLAERQAGPGVQAVAQMAVGYGCLYRARFSDARQHLEQAIALYRADQETIHASSYRHASGVAARSQLSWVLWTTGYPDQALEQAKEGLAMARHLRHPFTLALAMHSMALIHQFRNEQDECSRHAKALVDLATENGFVVFRALGLMAQGQTRADSEADTAAIDQGWTEFQGTGAEVGGTYFRALLAQTNARAGRNAEALRLIDEALVEAGRNEEYWWEPELHRVRGELLALAERRGVISAPTATTPRACMLEALRLARHHGAKLFELRAAKSLMLLGGDALEQADARCQLLAIVSWFTEGLETADVRDARALLGLDGL